MPKRRVIFLEGNGVLGEALVSEELRAGHIWAPTSYGLMCPCCGNIWARWEVMGIESHHATLCVLCPDHDTGRYSQAPVFVQAWPYNTSELPLGVLTRDYEYLLSPV